MWPLIATAVIAGGVAYLLWRLFRNKQKQETEQQFPPEVAERDADKDGRSSGRNPLSPEELRHQMLETIVSSVRFSKRVNLMPVEVPTGKMVETRLPTSDIDIEPVRSSADLLRVSASMQALDDDAFFGRYAAGNLSRPAFIEPETRVEYEEVPNTKVLLVLADLSGSMRESFRAPWMRRLVRMLAERSEKEKARFVLIPFTDFLHRVVSAESKEEYAYLYKYIANSLLIDGGTSITTALLGAVDYLKNEKLVDGRIVLITDGDDNVALNSIAEALKGAEAKLVTVAMATNREDLENVSEQIYSVR